MPNQCIGMFLKKGYIIVALCLSGALTNLLFSQIGGISTNFLASFNAQSIPKNNIQLEPSFSYSRSLGFFDGEREYKTITGVNILSSLNLRATYGLTENLEIGANVSTRLDVLNLGAKFHFLGNEKFGLALLGGINSNITSGARLLSSLDKYYIIGLASHFVFNEELSINASVQYQDLREYEGSDFILNAEAGYYINSNVLGITGIGLSTYSNSSLASSMLFTLYPGFAIERNNIIIVLQGQFDLFGENTPSNNGVRVSLRQLID